MRSKIDPNKRLHPVECVLTVVKHGEHAMFLLEEMRENGEYVMRKIHFIPKGATPDCYYGYGYGYLTNLLGWQDFGYGYGYGYDDFGLGYQERYFFDINGH